MFSQSYFASLGSPLYPERQTACGNVNLLPKALKNLGELFSSKVPLKNIYCNAKDNQPTPRTPRGGKTITQTEPGVA